MQSEGERRRLVWMVVLFFLASSCRQTLLNNSEDQLVDSQRKVLLVPDEMPETDSSKRTIYLTFDDGPNAGTPTVIDILQKENVAATFFLVGVHAQEIPRARKYLEVLRAMPKVELCNHSFTHAYRNHFELFYRKVDAVVADFIKCRNEIGFNNNIVRTPGNNIWRTPKFQATTLERYKPAANAIADSGFMVMGWDTEWRSKGLKLTQEPMGMAQEIDSMFVYNRNRFPKHCVLLMHDLTFRDSQDSTNLVMLLQHLKADGRYRFDVASSHPLLRYDERNGLEVKL
jgi:peptidoglycan/xylan/chitin deacetylase (PgdA/CDA1 family)